MGKLLNGCIKEAQVLHAEFHGNYEAFKDTHAGKQFKTVAGANITFDQYMKKQATSSGNSRDHVAARGDDVLAHAGDLVLTPEEIQTYEDARDLALEDNSFAANQAVDKEKDLRLLREWTSKRSQKPPRTLDTDGNLSCAKPAKPASGEQLTTSLLMNMEEAELRSIAEKAVDAGMSKRHLAKFKTYFRFDKQKLVEKIMAKLGGESRRRRLARIERFAREAIRCQNAK